jgi:hypothetical protein
MIRYWQVSGQERAAAERQVLAPARRLSGLAINDAEESLDRMMLEPGFGKKASSGDIQTEALTFVTYLRRLMRVATTLTTVGAGGASSSARVEAIIVRLEAMSAALAGTGGFAVAPAHGAAPQDDGTTGSVEEQQMRRMERQVGVLERTAAELLGKSAG